jgi:NitT/TauT family transport system permease protein
LKPGRKRGRAERSLLFAASILAMLGLWQWATAYVPPLFLPSPLTVFSRLVELAGGGAFWANLGATLWRGFIGFALSAAAGLAMGVLTGLSPVVRDLARPPLMVLRSTPVVAVIFVILLYASDDAVPILSCFLMSFPIVTESVAAAIWGADPRLLEMARNFRVGFARTLSGVYLPTVAPQYLSSCVSALGLGWKVVVAAEVLNPPALAVGRCIRYAKEQIDSVDVYAWTLAALALSALTEALFSLAKKGADRVRLD